MASEEPFEILRNHRSKMQSFEKIRSLVEEMRQCKAPCYFWTTQEHDIYVEILKIYCKEIENKSERKELCIYSMMSQIISTRSPKQVKTHHQKMLKRWHDISGIIQFSRFSYLQDEEKKIRKNERKRQRKYDRQRREVEVKEEQWEKAIQEEEEDPKRKLRNFREKKKEVEQMEEVPKAKEVKQEVYYPFLSLFENGNPYNLNYAWNSTLGYEPAQPVKYEDAQKWY